MSEAGSVSVNPRLIINLPDPEDRNSTAADRLKNAVLCLLVECGTPLLADALKPEEVTKRASKSRASYYRSEGFPASDANTAHIRRAVLEQVIAQALERSAHDLSQIVGSITEYIDSGWVSESPREFIRSTSEENFDAMADHMFIVQLMTGALAPSSAPLGSALGDYYRKVTESYASVYHKTLRFWGYRPKPPMTVEKVAMVLMALAEGLMLRYMGDDSIDRALFGELVSTVGTSLLVAEGDLADDALPPEHHLPGEVAPPSRAAIINALVRLFESERAALPTTEELAEAVGCTPQTIRARFGGVVGVIRAAWDEWIPEFEEAAERNRQMLRGPDPMNVLYRVAVAVATRAAEQQPLTRALLMSEVGLGPLTGGGGGEAILSIVERLLVEAAEAGDFSAPSIGQMANGADRNAAFARAFRGTLLNTVISHPVPPGLTLTEHARGCVDYVWALMMPGRGAAR